VRFPVQLVLRPDANFRGFAGQVARGTLRPGDRVMALPSRRESAVSRIVTYDGDLPAAAHPQAVTVELEDEIDLSRGEMLVHAGSGDTLPEVSNHFRAMVVWMHEDPLVVGRTYIAKHTTRSVRATVRAIRYRVDVNSQQHLTSDSIAMNEIAEVEFETNLPLFFDRYADCRQTGSLILIDPLSNATVGAVMITGALENVANVATDAARTSLVLLGGGKDLATRVRDALFARGDNAVLIDDDLIAETAIPSVVRALELAGAIAISTRPIPQAVLGEIKAFAGVVHAEDQRELDTILNAVTGTR
jgi:bifunctional enzyme CysN/CysC/sulfate adenylyltransferase subunit 1